MHQDSPCAWTRGVKIKRWLLAAILQVEYLRNLLSVKVMEAMMSFTVNWAQGEIGQGVRVRIRVRVTGEGGSVGRATCGTVTSAGVLGTRE